MLKFDKGVRWIFIMATAVTSTALSMTSDPRHTSHEGDGSEEDLKPLCPEVSDDSEYGEPSYFPHPHSCRVYYECSQGKLSIEPCSSGLMFNALEKTCDFPENVICLHVEDEGILSTAQYSAEGNSKPSDITRGYDDEKLTNSHNDKAVNFTEPLDPKVGKPIETTDYGIHVNNNRIIRKKEVLPGDIQPLSSQTQTNATTGEVADVQEVNIPQEVVSLEDSSGRTNSREQLIISSNSQTENHDTVVEGFLSQVTAILKQEVTDDTNKVEPITRCQKENEDCDEKLKQDVSTHNSNDTLQMPWGISQKVPMEVNLENEEKLELGNETTLPLIHTCSELNTNCIQEVKQEVTERNESEKVPGTISPDEISNSDQLNNDESFDVLINNFLSEYLDSVRKDSKYETPNIPYDDADDASLADEQLVTTTERIETEDVICFNLSENCKPGIQTKLNNVSEENNHFTERNEVITLEPQDETTSSRIVIGTITMDPVVNIGTENSSDDNVSNGNVRDNRVQALLNNTQIEFSTKHHQANLLHENEFFTLKGMPSTPISDSIGEEGMFTSTIEATASSGGSGITTTAYNEIFEAITNSTSKNDELSKAPNSTFLMQYNDGFADDWTHTNPSLPSDVGEYSLTDSVDESNLNCLNVSENCKSKHNQEQSKVSNTKDAISETQTLEIGSETVSSQISTGIEGENFESSDDLHDDADQNKRVNGTTTDRIGSELNTEVAKLLITATVSSLSSTDTIFIAGTTRKQKNKPKHTVSGQIDRPMEMTNEEPLVLNAFNYTPQPVSKAPNTSTVHSEMQKAPPYEEKFEYADSSPYDRGQATTTSGDRLGQISVSKLNRHDALLEDASTNNETGYFNECENKMYLPHECSPVHFYNCKSGQKIRMKCPDGTFFDRETSTCTWPPHGTCQTYYSKDCDATSAYLADKDDPTAFYQCSNGAFYRFNCPRNLVFNKEHNVCDWPQDVGPEDDSRDEEPGDSTCPNGNCNKDNFAPSSDFIWSRPAVSDAVSNKGYDNSWFPVVGARPHPEDAYEKPQLLENPKYPSVSMSGPRNEQKTTPGRQYHYVTITTTESNPSARADSTTKKPGEVTTLRRVPANQMGLTTERTSHPFLMDDSDVSVSVDTLSGAINIASNHSDVMVHFKPGKHINETTADVTISKTLSGVLTVRTGISTPKEQGTNITLTFKGSKNN